MPVTIKIEGKTQKEIDIVDKLVEEFIKLESTEGQTELTIEGFIIKRVGILED